jgi:c-di-GMP-binding flagellar brake protein YcgR
MLSYLFGNKVLLSIKVPGKFATSTLLTTINGIENSHVLLGGFQNVRLNKDLLMQNELEVSAYFDGIAVNFCLSELSGHDIGAEFNLKALLPKSMEWVQRRNTRRVHIPIKLPVKIQYKNQAECFDVADISIAGLSYIAPN